MTTPQVLAVELRGIDKSFYGVHANKGVDFELRQGEVHALLGENGAGKSTLCSVMAGLYRPDAGEVLVMGEPATFKSPKESLAAGIGMVYQHFRLVPNLTVAENLALGHPDLPVRISMTAMEKVARDLGDRYGLPVDPTARIWELSVGEQQRVEILKLLYRDVRVLILDEPTAVLTPQEADSLFATVRLMTAEGRSVIFVSHKLGEVKAISDRVTVLRGGECVGSVDTKDSQPSDLARLMVGKDLVSPGRGERREPGGAVMEVADLSVKDDRGLDAVNGVSFTIRSGEVLGVAGVSGNGQRELAYGLAGLRPPAGGKVHLDGTDVTNLPVLARIKRGLAYVPQSRLGMGLAPGLSTPDNLALKGFRAAPFTVRRRLAKRAFESESQRLVDAYDIRGVRPGLPIRMLSGGNLQKALIAREVTQKPKVLIARSPTRGLDVAATNAVRGLLLSERERGAGVLLISEDLDELFAVADRLIVLYEGRIVGEFPVDGVDTATLGLLMAGHQPEDAK
ncbi:MAG: ABC transporter ATP-binding protein [Acidimicrobiia bacterium]|nr:ABC transporter ATP-binding protein [Acidimicrobiia bacterium]